MSICCLVQVLEQAFFLLGQFVFVCLTWVATQVTSRIATVHGMMLDQPVRLSYAGPRHSARQVCGLGNFYLSSHSHVVFVTALGVDESGLFVAHPPRPTARCTGLPPITGVPDRLAFPFLPALALASGCAAACFRDKASFNASVNFLDSVILLFTSLACSITKFSLCVNEKGPCGPFCLASQKIHSDFKTITHILSGGCSPFHSSLLWLNIQLYV